MYSVLVMFVVDIDIGYRYFHGNILRLLVLSGGILLLVRKEICVLSFANNNERSQIKTLSILTRKFNIFIENVQYL